MSRQALLPSPNWFLNSLADCSPDGTLAYGSRNGLVLVRSVQFAEGSAPSPNFSLIPNAHKERITSVSFSNRRPNEDVPDVLLASSGDDNAVAIWDTDALELIQKHHEHKNTIIGLDWSKTGDLSLVSADDKGYIIVWDLARNDIRVLSMLTSSSRLAPNVIKCSPVNQDLVAVGCKDGLVCIINIKGLGVIVSRMRGHDKSVYSLSWCPGTSKLASTGLDQNIIVWNSGLAEKTFQLPNKSLTGVVKVKPGERSNSNLWSPVIFVDSNCIISGCPNAEVLSWDPTQETPTMTLLHSEHARGLFGLTFHGKVVWSLSQDRLLLRHDLSTNTTSTFPTLGGFVYCIVPCPFAPGRVAVGVGDETIRVWSLSDNTGKSSAIIWQRIKGKVLALAWHPEKEGELAFGTSDGRVGICNASNPSKEPFIMKQYHRQSVYRVGWGPPVHKKDQACPAEKWCLYACDESWSVVYLDSGKVTCSLKDIIKATNPQIKGDVKHKDIAWKQDRSLLALGLDDGSIRLLTAPNLHCIHTLLSHKKMIFFLSWHPSSTAVHAQEEKRQNWLASTSMDQMIHVYDLSPLLSEGEDNVWKGASLPLEPMTEMRHGGKVVSLAWNPHIGGQLASSSYDMSVKVWDVTKNELLACYVNHKGVVLSCCWSALDPDVVMSGSADFTCRTWNVSETSAENKPAVRPKFREEQKGVTPIPVPTVAFTAIAPERKSIEQPPAKHQERQAAPKATKMALFPLSNASFVRNSMECCLHLLDTKGLDPPGKRLKSEQNGSSNGSITEEVNHFGFFTNQEEAVELFTKEANALKKMNSYAGLTNLKLWQGDLQQVVKDSTKAKKLDDWLVSMAPSVSHKFWLETCSAYADQLVEEDKIIKATSYFVACNRESDAVVTLQKNKFFKEAISLCHLRLSSDDPLLQQTLRAWGKYSLDTGNYEIATQCFIAVGDYEKAAVVLAKRKDPKMWQLGTYLAKLANANELFLNMTVECYYHFLMNQDWTAAKEIIGGLDDMKHLEQLLQVHELVCAKEKEGLDLEKVWNNTDSVLDKIEEIYKDSTPEQFLHLTQLFPVSPQLPENRKELLVATSKLLLLAGAGRAIHNEDWERYVVHALHLNYRRSLVLVKEKPLHLLISWLGVNLLTKYKASEESYRAAAFIGSVNKDDPNLFATLEKYKTSLMDSDSANHARLVVQLSDLEKQLALAQATNSDISPLQQKMIILTSEKENVEKSRVAFPYPFVLFCKLQGLVDGLQSKADQEKLDLFEKEMDSFRALLQG